MSWYIAFSVIFTVYAIDLVFLFVASLFAAVTEHFVPSLSTAATRAHRKAVKQQQPAAAHRGKTLFGGKEVTLTGGKDLSIVVDTRNQVRLLTKQQQQQQQSSSSSRAAAAAAEQQQQQQSSSSSSGGCTRAAYFLTSHLACGILPFCTAPSSSPQNAAALDVPIKAPVADFSHLTDLYDGEFPKVLIQLPMYNEDAHCDLIIQRCCKIKWPSHRLLIQVCAAAVAALSTAVSHTHTHMLQLPVHTSSRPLPFPVLPLVLLLCW